MKGRPITVYVCCYIQLDDTHRQLDVSGGRVIYELTPSNHVTFILVDRVSEVDFATYRPLSAITLRELQASSSQPAAFSCL